MSKIKILHSADLHLDSPFQGLTAGKAAIRRAEQRQLLSALGALAREEKADIVLLAGDLLDSGNTYCETGEELARCLGQMEMPVFISPGNHDWYSPKCPYARLKLPENVHVFTKPEIEYVELPELGCVVHGAAFTAPERLILNPARSPSPPSILTASSRVFTPYTSIPSISTASAAALTGRIMPAMPLAAASSAYTSAPGTWRTLPSRPSSPMII